MLVLWWALGKKTQIGSKSTAYVVSMLANHLFSVESGKQAGDF
jgi:hypothetical protein